MLFRSVARPSPFKAEPTLKLRSTISLRLKHEDVTKTFRLHIFFRKRAAGIEPASSAWKAEVLPLNYARTGTNQLVKNDPVASVPVHYDHAPPPVSLLTRTDTLPGGSRTRLMLAYGLGDAGTGLAATQLGFYLFPFFTCAAGLPAFIAGSLLTVIKVWDAINDPLKIGRAHV